MAPGPSTIAVCRRGGRDKASFMAPSPERVRGLPQNLAALAAKLTHYPAPHPRDGSGRLRTWR